MAVSVKVIVDGSAVETLVVTLTLTLVVVTVVLHCFTVTVDTLVVVPAHTVFVPA
jgi:hypothetical protein